MSEPRCGLVHMRSGHLLAKLSRGDCLASTSELPLTEGTLRKFRNASFEFKLQVAESDNDGNPRLLWIRIGKHPQRCLCVGQDGDVRLESWLSPGASEPLWRIHYLEAQPPAGPEEQDYTNMFPTTCILQNAKTGLCLSVRDGIPVLKEEGDIWGFVRLRDAATPGRVLRRTALLGGGGVALASVGAAGVAGVAVAGAATRGVGAATTAGTAVAGTVTAVTTAAKAVSGLTVAKAAAAAMSVPGAVMAAVAAGTAAVTTVGAAGTTVYYAAVGLGCGYTLAAGGAVAGVMTSLVGSAKDPGLYVEGMRFVPAPLMRSISKLSVQSTESGALGRTESEAAFDN